MGVTKKVPTLRFPGFNGEWEIKKLGNISTIVGGGTPSKNEESYWNGNIPWISSSDIAEENVREINVKKYITKSGLNNSSTKKCPSGTILIVSRVGVGKVALSRQEVCTSQDFANITYISEDSLFSTYSLSILLKKESNRTQGTSIKGITTDEIKGFKLLFPSLSEQQKIADCLTAMDETMEAQQQKVEQLQAYKKGLLQQLFSQTLRFPGFEGEWEEKKLGEVANCLDNLRKPLNNQERQTKSGAIPYYGANGIVDYIDDYIFDKKLVLLAEDGGNFDDFSNRPIAQLIKGKSWVNNHAHVLEGKENTDFLFFSLVHKDIRKYINGTSRAKLNKADMLEIKLNLPPLSEQQKIANCLSLLDEVIELEQQKLEKLQVYKKGLLQQLFV